MTTTTTTTNKILPFLQYLVDYLQSKPRIQQIRQTDQRSDASSNTEIPPKHDTFL